MMTNQRRKAALCLLIGTAIGLVGQRSAVAEDGIGPELRKALEENAAALSPLTVTWERTRASEFPEETVLSVAGMPPTGREFMAPERVRFMWQDGKFYCYFWRHMPQGDADGNVLTDKPLQVQEQEISCDLEAFYSGNPNRRLGEDLGDPLIIIDPIAKMVEEESMAKICRAEYLYVAGFRLPVTPEQLTSEAPKALLLEFLQQGGKFTQATIEEIDGDSHTAVELTKDGQRHRFVLDPQRGHALRRQTMLREQRYRQWSCVQSFPNVCNAFAVFESSTAPMDMIRQNSQRERICIGSSQRKHRIFSTTLAPTVMIRWTGAMITISSVPTSREIISTMSFPSTDGILTMR